ncbi:hypothetical protein GPDM_09740 [Planococcus donghaensis MPA1U2]|uniref:Uncharacterized protein n=1 Tax=Planococcus donghaensis MPA1U2 TaxID=933115 RepID=E7RH64_9BACL|nr:hypothetical protein GPDM_09740 [Planococcus donghaensis MPA1U2]
MMPMRSLLIGLTSLASHESFATLEAASSLILVRL